MYLDQTPEQKALRKELRAYFEEMMTPEVRAELGSAGEDSTLFRTLVGKLGHDGWLGIGWPTEYGGQGRPVTDQFIFFDEVQRAGAPFPFVTVIPLIEMVIPRLAVVAKTEPSCPPLTVSRLAPGPWIATDWPI